MQDYPMQEEPMQDEMPDELAGDEVQATDEEQQLLEEAVFVAMGVIHNPEEAGDNIAQMVLESEDVTEGIGRAAATTLIATEKQMQIPDDMKVALSEEIIIELAGLAVEAGALAEDEITDDFIDAMASHAYSSYLETKEAMGELEENDLAMQVGEAEELMGGQPGAAQPQQPQPQQRGLLNPGV